MAHQRQNIRTAVFNAISSLAAGNVVIGRVYPEDQSLLPAIGVYTPEESWEEETFEFTTPLPSPAPQNRTLNVQITVADEGIDYLDKLDGHALDIEQALNQDLELGGACDLFVYAGCDVEESGALETPSGRMAINYIAEYRVDLRDPQANL